MNKSLSARIMDLLQRRQLKGTLAKIALTISCVAIFLITYLLVAPVLTQEWETVCGMEEHVHTEECYTLVPADSAEAAEPTGAVKPAEPAEPAEPAQGGHHHTDECYEEVPAEPGEGGHHHTDECYEEVIVEPAVEGHSHTSDCYEESSSLSCGMSEHSHSDGCLDEEGNQVCGMDEHSHSDSCYETSSELVCGQEETEGREAKTERQLICGQEETDGQETATERRLVCGMEETDGAEETTGETAEEPAGEDEAEETGEADAEGQEPEMIRVLTCGKEEHVHSDQCYQKHEISGPEYICGFLTEHAHDDSCYFESGELKCTIPEHTHDDSCLPAQTLGGQNNHIGDGIFPEELPDGYQEANVFQPDGAMFAMTDEDGANQQGIQARVYMPKNAFGTEVMFVPQPLDETDEAYAAFAAKLAETEDYDSLTAMDLGFVAADEESENCGDFLEPNTESGPVYVRLTVPMEISEETELAFWHYVNDGEEAAEGAAEKVTADFTYEDGVLTVDFAADSFSAFGITTKETGLDTQTVQWGVTPIPEKLGWVDEDGVRIWQVAETALDSRIVRIPVRISTSGWANQVQITLPYKLDVERTTSSGIQPTLESGGLSNAWKVDVNEEKNVVTLTRNETDSTRIDDVYYVFDCWNVPNGREFKIDGEVGTLNGVMNDFSLEGKIVTGHDVGTILYEKDNGESDYAFSGFGGVDKTTAYITSWNSVCGKYFDWPEEDFNDNYVYDIAPFVIEPKGQQPYDISGTFTPGEGGELVSAIYMMDSRKNPDALHRKVTVAEPTKTADGRNQYSFTLKNDELVFDGRTAVVSNLLDPTDSKAYTLYFLVKYPKKPLIQVGEQWQSPQIKLDATLSLTHTGIDSNEQKEITASVCLYNGQQDPVQGIYWAVYSPERVSNNAGLTILKKGKPATLDFITDFFCLNEARESSEQGVYKLEAIIDLSYLITNSDDYSQSPQLKEDDYRFSSFNLSLIDAQGSWSQNQAAGTPNIGWTPDKFEKAPMEQEKDQIKVYGSASLTDDTWTPIGTVDVNDVWAKDQDRAFRILPQTIPGNYVRLKVVYNSRYTTALKVGYQLELQPQILEYYEGNVPEKLNLTTWLNYVAYKEGETVPDLYFAKYPVTDGDVSWSDRWNAGLTRATINLARSYDIDHPCVGYRIENIDNTWDPLYSFRNFAKAELGSSKDVAGMVISQILYDSSQQVVGTRINTADLVPADSYSRKTEVANVSEIVYSFSGIATNGANNLTNLQKWQTEAGANSLQQAAKQRYYVLLPEGLKLNENPQGLHYGEGYLSANSTFYRVPDGYSDDSYKDYPKVVDSGQTDVPVSDVNAPGLNKDKSDGSNWVSEMYWEADGDVTHKSTKMVDKRQLIVFERILPDYMGVQFETRFDPWDWTGKPTHFWGRGLSFSAVPVNGTGTLPAGDYTAEFWCQYLDGKGNPISAKDFGRIDDVKDDVLSNALGDNVDADTLLYIPSTFKNNSTSSGSTSEIEVGGKDVTTTQDGVNFVKLEGDYQYELKYQFSDTSTTTATDVVLWCNVEGYNRNNVKSDWKGAVAGVNLNGNQNVEVYVQTGEINANEYINADHSWLTESDRRWQRVESLETCDWSQVRSIAFYFGNRKFSKGDSASVFINMKAPAESDIKKELEKTEYKAYNEFLFSNSFESQSKWEDGHGISGRTELAVEVAPLGYILPSTGGAGSATMCATGMALILAAMGLMYLTLRRSRKQREGGNV